MEEILPSLMCTYNNFSVWRRSAINGVLLILPTVQFSVSKHRRCTRDCIFSINGVSRVLDNNFQYHKEIALHWPPLLLAPIKETMERVQTAEASVCKKSWNDLPLRLFAVPLSNTKPPNYISGCHKICEISMWTKRWLWYCPADAPLTSWDLMWVFCAVVPSRMCCCCVHCGAANFIWWFGWVFLISAFGLP